MNKNEGKKKKKKRAEKTDGPELDRGGIKWKKTKCESQSFKGLKGHVGCLEEEV